MLGCRVCVCVCLRVCALAAMLMNEHSHIPTNQHTHDLCTHLSTATTRARLLYTHTHTQYQRRPKIIFNFIYKFYRIPEELSATSATRRRVVSSRLLCTENVRTTDGARELLVVERSTSRERSPANGSCTSGYVCGAPSPSSWNSHEHRAQQLYTSDRKKRRAVRSTQQQVD